MAIYKRKDSPYYWVKFSIPNKGSIRRSTGTSDRNEAIEFEIELKADMLRESRRKVTRDYSWGEAADRWLEEKADKRSIESDKAYLKWLGRHLGRSVALRDIDADTVRFIREAREKSPNPLTGQRVSASTVGHHLKLMRAVLRKARDEWGWIDTIPKIVIPNPKNKRERWLTKEEAVRLINELPKHLADAAMFTLQTGLRAGNLRSLRWWMIDLKHKVIHIPGDEMKNGQPHTVPLNEIAIAILEAQEYREGYVFRYEGTQIKSFSTAAWRSALKRANINDFWWLDLRHTWASWHVMLGTELHELQRLGGWSSFDLVLRYAHLSTEKLAESADALGRDSSQWAWLTRAA